MVGKSKVLAPSHTQKIFNYTQTNYAIPWVLLYLLGKANAQNIIKLNLKIHNLAKRKEWIKMSFISGGGKKLYKENKPIYMVTKVALLMIER